MLKEFFKEIYRIRYFFLLCVVIGLVLYDTKVIYKNISENNKEISLVRFGDNIDYGNNKPFVENGGIYISKDTISKILDENIYYDKIASKVIITTYSDVVKLKISDKKISRNMEYSDISNEAKFVEGQAYVPINEVKDIYKIDVEYDYNTNTIVVDKKNYDFAKVKYNKVLVYSYINTKSDVLGTLNKNDEVISYTDSLNHVRWIKIKTKDGKVGYISKNSADITKYVEDQNTQNNSRQDVEKINMFWQYGSNLNTMGTNKIDGVNVVSPTWYELKNSNGDISSKYSQEYYNQAKKNGYKVWPIITNGIDSVSYSPEDTSAMLNSEYNREQFIKNILKVMENNKLDGINIDFESMKTEDKDIYTQFIRELAPLVRKLGKTVSVDMYFVAYIDRARVGEATDYVVLMGYDQRGNWSNTSGSISEVSWVESNVSSLINDSEIDSKKIILGIPFYTRLWTEKTGSSKPTTTVYSMQDCITFINRYGVTPVWDENAGQNYAQVEKGDTTYKLWIEDVNSIKKRVETVKKYNLAGVSAWRKGLETSDVWKVIKENLQ
ncbi:MAG: glycosyl hydrolase family 18 protein [Clostridia bacterium]|nr:glycosyl hydrolase family 18 protein [Clostridia bacterium]